MFTWWFSIVKKGSPKTILSFYGLNVAAVWLWAIMIYGNGSQFSVKGSLLSFHPWKNMSSSVGMIVPRKKEKQKWQPNHQPVYIYIAIEPTSHGIKTLIFNTIKPWVHPPSRGRGTSSWNNSWWNSAHDGTKSSSCAKKLLAIPAMPMLGCRCPGC